VASEVKTIHPDALKAAGVRETGARERLIDDFSRGFHDWFQLNPTNTQHWQMWTRKVTDPSWTGPDQGGELTFEITTTGPDTLGVKLLVDWNETSANTYAATVPITAAGTATVSLPRTAFLNLATNQPLADWDQVVAFALMSGDKIDANLAVWSGGIPSIDNLHWTGGEYVFANGVGSDWLELHGLTLNDSSVFGDADGDGALEWQEFAAGTDPIDPLSVFRAMISGSESGQLTLAWPAVAGKTYDLWHSTDLSDGSWSMIEGDLPYSGSMGTKTVPFAGERGFFRIGVR
jgi:hypothetical protein